MKRIEWSKGTWTRQPTSVTEEAGALKFESAEGSDWWRITSYGFIHNDGHALVTDFPNESAMEVSFILDYTEQFDQCGIFLTANDENWIKAGVEFCDGYPQVGAVVTRETSDWSSARISEWVGKEITVRASRSGDAVTIRAGMSGDLQLVRVAPLSSTLTWKAGPMACAPTRSGLVTKITSWSIGEKDQELH
jgi:regulation of enolase protein 1 (concanavalin A-like superfamily)